MTYIDIYICLGSKIHMYYPYSRNLCLYVLIACKITKIDDPYISKIKTVIIQ